MSDAPSPAGSSSAATASTPTGGGVSTPSSYFTGVAGSGGDRGGSSKKGVGQNQLGKKRGPYKKMGRYDNLLTPVPLGGEKVESSTGAKGEDGRIRGLGLLDYDERVWALAGWWEIKGLFRLWKQVNHPLYF